MIQLMTVDFFVNSAYTVYFGDLVVFYSICCVWLVSMVRFIAVHSLILFNRLSISSVVRFTAFDFLNFSFALFDLSPITRFYRSIFAFHNDAIYLDFSNCLEIFPKRYLRSFAESIGRFTKVVDTLTIQPSLHMLTMNLQMSNLTWTKSSKKSMESATLVRTFHKSLTLFWIYSTI